VAYLRCGGIFKHDFVANLPLSELAKKNCENRLIFREFAGKSLVSCFLTHGVHIFVQRLKLSVLLFY